jgi:hypothetical protein
VVSPLVKKRLREEEERKKKQEKQREENNKKAFKAGSWGSGKGGMGKDKSMGEEARALEKAMQEAVKAAEEKKAQRRAGLTVMDQKKVRRADVICIMYYVLCIKPTICI